jgi:hypothetical protein
MVLMGGGNFMGLLDWWQVLCKGYELSNAEMWKNIQNAINIVAGILFVIVQNYQLPIDKDMVNLLAGGIVAVVNIILTIATSKRIGLPTGGDT